jgi:hypothetical protein
MEYLKTKLDISGNSEVRQRLVEKCNAIDLKKMAKDVEPFLINPDDRERILLFPQLIQTMML